MSVAAKVESILLDIVSVVRRNEKLVLKEKKSIVEGVMMAFVKMNPA